MQQDEQKLMPIIKLGNTEFIVDVDRRQFREFKNPDNSINMHSEKGKDMLMEMIGRQWDCFGSGKPVAEN